MSSDSRDDTRAYDVIVIGGGPAGLSAALVLGRCRRRVLVCDAGRPRNAPSHAAHGFYTRDGTPPEQLREIAIEQLRPYDVEVRLEFVTEARQTSGGFEVRASQRTFRARKLLLATGMRDREPAVAGVRELAGSGVFHCPYCDGWDVRDLRLGTYAPGRDGADCALGLITWSSRVTLFSDGPAPLERAQRDQLARHGIEVHEERVSALQRDGETLTGVRLESGRIVPLDALFVHAGMEQRSALARSFGCEFEPGGAVRVAPGQTTSCPGLFVAGDAAGNVQSIATAVAEGYVAATSINRELRQEDHP